MIDLDAARRRMAWLADLKIGEVVIFHVGTRRKLAEVYRLERDRIWVSCHAGDGTEIWSWVHRDTGDCPAARTRIEPLDASPAAFDVLDGGWEAA